MKFTLLLTIILLTPLLGQRYAIVVSEETSSLPGWNAVVESLAVKHSGYVFIWHDAVAELKDELASFQPDYIAFVGQRVTEINQGFVLDIWELTRELDADPYGDAICIMPGFILAEPLQ